MSAALDIPSWAINAAHPSGGRQLSSAELFKALRKIDQLEMRMSRIREMQLSSYILIYDRATWRWLYSHARGRFQRQLCMGQRSWSAWEYTGRTINVNSKKTGKPHRLSEQAMKIGSIETLLRRAGHSKPDTRSIPEYAVRPGEPIHHVTENIHASSRKRIISTLIIGISGNDWSKAVNLPWAKVTYAKEVLRMDPTDGGLARAREHCRVAWHAGLFDRQCWLAPPLEWVIEVEARRYVRKPKPMSPAIGYGSKKIAKETVIGDDFDIVKYSSWSGS